MHRKQIAASLFAAPFIVGALILLHACGGGDGNHGGGGQQPGAVPQAAQFSGKFQGTDQGTQGGVPFQAALTLTLTQTSNQVSGDYAESAGGIGAGSVIGTATENNLSFTGTDNVTGCTFSGTATLNGDELTGKATNPAQQNCPALDAAFDLFRQGAPSPTPTATVTSTPTTPTNLPTTCQQVDQKAKQLVNNFSPDASSFCETDNDCTYLSNVGIDSSESNGLCLVHCGVMTQGQADAWTAFLQNDSQLNQVCQERVALNCNHRAGECCIGQMKVACVNHGCVKVSGPCASDANAP